MEYTGNEYILFLLQNPIDTSLNPLYERGEEYDLWINKTIKEIKKISNKKKTVLFPERPSLVLQLVATSTACFTLPRPSAARCGSPPVFSTRRTGTSRTYDVRART